MLRLVIPVVVSVAAFSSGAHPRVVVSGADNSPVPYASVGLLHHTLGTVADSLGHFSMTVPADCLGDTLRISAIGYLHRDFIVRDLLQMPDTIRLDDDAISLGEVVVKPLKIKHRTAGRKGSGGFIYINVEGYKAAGQGLAVALNVRKRAWVKSLGFTVVDNAHTLSKMKFRINFYRKDGGEYVPEKIKPYYFDYRRSDLRDGKYEYVFPEEVLLDKGEYYVELEFLSNFENEFFYMQSRPLTGKTRYRYASQSKWETLPFGAPLYVDYDSEE